MEKANSGITFLNFDETLMEQKTLLKIPHHWIDLSDIKHTNGFCEWESYEEIKRRIDEKKTGSLVFIGNGNYHYVTSILLEKISKPFSLVLFDHHADMMTGDESLISCGSWVDYALKTNQNLRKVLIIGVNQKDFSLYSNNHPAPDIFMIPEQKLLETPLRQIIQESRTFLKDETNLYISIDKDVLSNTESYTNWDHGKMSLVQMLFIIGQLSNFYNIFSIDVCGEYIGSWAHQFDSIEMEHIKMNEIVNWTIINFVEEIGLIQPRKKYPSLKRQSRNGKIHA